MWDSMRWKKSGALSALSAASSEEAKDDLMLQAPPSRGPHSYMVSCPHMGMSFPSGEPHSYMSFLTWGTLSFQTPSTLRGTQRLELCPVGCGVPAWIRSCQAVGLGCCV